MCGRFTLRTPAVVLAKHFLVDAKQFDFLTVRYNIAPTQTVLAIRESSPGKREPVRIRWGLIPSWAKDLKSAPLINARAETVAEKPAFRSAFKRRRCLVPADGYYEWQATGAKTKQAFYYHRSDEEPFAFAGLWESWHGSAEDSVISTESCTLITTEANKLAGKVHDRMPVILHEADYAAWLDPINEDREALKGLLVPLSNGVLTVDRVSSYVNKASNQGADCIAPAG